MKQCEITPKPPTPSGPVPAVPSRCSCVSPLFLLRKGILADGRVDELEAQMLLRLAEPFERFGDGKVSRIVAVLRQMLSDGEITDIESQRIARILDVM